MIQEGFPEEVAFNCWGYSEEMRRMLAEIHKFITHPWSSTILVAKSGFEPSFPVLRSCALSLDHSDRNWLLSCTDAHISIYRHSRATFSVAFLACTMLSAGEVVIANDILGACDT